MCASEYGVRHGEYKTTCKNHKQHETTKLLLHRLINSVELDLKLEFLKGCVLDSGQYSTLHHWGENKFT